MISLCAGTVLPVGPARTINIAAAAGYTHVGLRIDPSTTDPKDWAGLRRRADDLGVAIFDTEVVRLGLTPRDHIEQLIHAAAVLGARWLLTVSHHDDPSVTTDDLAWMTARCTSLSAALRPALEFMGFTAVRTIDDAAAVISHTGAGIVMDALHLFRTGATADDVSRVMAAPDAPSAYLQLCDTSVADIAAEDLADEARHHREIPGTGLLPLAALLAAVPEDTAVAVEVQSDSLLDRMGPQAMAAACRSAIGRLLS